MNLIFVDTSYLVALLSPRDAIHPRAQEFSRGLTRPLITTEYILLIEAANFFSTLPGRTMVARLCRQLKEHPDFSIVLSSHELYEKGLSLYEASADKQWSLTDCISFIVMDEHKITDALTTDHHFTQAGFKVLLPTT